MEASDHRLIVSQLNDTLSWLEDYCRKSTELAPQSGQLRYAASLVRNIFGPHLDGQKSAPLHIAVVGGAGTGKSTIVNFLAGAVVAEANPQAGYTRHPTAYIPGSGPYDWPAQLGFLGPLQRLPQSAPANLDQDVYQVKRFQTATGDNLLQDCVIWDCPDMTTWAASGYVPRLIEIAGLADVIVYVASDERYNDEVPTQFLQLLIKSGKPVVVCITKMRESDAAAMVKHFQTDVLARLIKTSQGKLPVPVLPIPFLTQEQLADPIKKSGTYRIQLLNQILAFIDPTDDARRRSVQHALRYLNTSSDGLLEVARQDLTALEDWRSLVQTAQLEFEGRYRREFLNGERFRRFDEARDQLLELLELPGAGKVLSGIFWVLRLPYRLIQTAMGKALTRPDTVNLPEHDVLHEAMRGWIDQLRAESIRRANTHPLWKHVANGFNSGLAETAMDRFENDFRRFQIGSADEIEANSRSITSTLEKNYSSLATFRITKLILEIAAIILGFWAGGFGWISLLWVPLFVSIVQQLVELIVRQYVEIRREQSRSRKQSLISQFLTTPMTEWLSNWPATGGSAYEKLQLALRRVPLLIRQLTDVYEKKTGPAHPPKPKPDSTS